MMVNVQLFILLNEYEKGWMRFGVEFRLLVLCGFEDSPQSHSPLVEMTNA